MSFIEFIQLLLGNKKWLVGFPLLTGTVVFFLTRNSPHTYSTDMVIYTGIASGYNLDNDMEGKIDYHEANSKFDNLINTITGKETKKEVALRLLTDRIHHKEELKQIISNSKLEKLNWLSDSADIILKTDTSAEITYERLNQEIRKGNQNAYYQLLYGPEENPFNLNTLNGIKASRMGFSDMVKVEYTAEDALITKKTLDILAEVFLEKYKGMRIGEVNNVVKYFEEQTALAMQRLQKAETSLKTFRTQNRVINYDEQTKYIADQNEDFQQKENQLEMDLQGSQLALNKIESKLNGRSLLQLQSDEVVKTRNELSAQFNSIGLALVKNDLKGSSTEKIESLKNSLKENIQGLYDLNNTTEGVNGKDLLNQWLELTVNVQENTAKLNVLRQNKAVFEKVYDHFAPMGSELSKLERDVDVAEKEYLTLLHNLNQANLRARNLTVSENISIIDPADLPIVPNSSKRLILVLASYVSCLLLVIVILILKEYMDDSISNPGRLTKLTGLKTATAFAKINSGDQKLNDNIDQLSFQRWSLSLLNAQDEHENRKAKIIAFPLHKTKTDIPGLLNVAAMQMNNAGNEWLASNMAAEMNPEKHQLIYSANSNHELIRKDVLKSCSMIYVFVNAAMKMGDYQQELLENWKSLNIPMQAILINTKINHLENYIGEIPKERSKLRKRIKDIVWRYSK